MAYADLLCIDASKNMVQQRIRVIRECEERGVSKERGQEVKWDMQKLVQGNLEEYNPPVMISYATGTRQDLDAEGGGPGMLYAQLIAWTLAQHGIDTFSGLHVPAGAGRSRERGGAREDSERKR